MRPDRRWEVTSTDQYEQRLVNERYQAVLETLLAAGWEPFSVTYPTNFQHRIWLRRQVDRVS